MDLNSIINKNRLMVETRLEQLLTPQYPEIIYEAMSYSVKAGGKRMRPLLLLGVYNAMSGNAGLSRAVDFACAIEMIHTYSLIHDDLPVLDNDDFRRGKPTNHKVFGEAMALLAGDALLNRAYEVMADVYADKITIKAMGEIAAAAGTKGMIGGQVMDILSEGKQIDLEVLTYIHQSKTAALIQASVSVGAILAEAPESLIEVFRKAGKQLGLAFQIQDDILDVSSTNEVLGKPVMSDQKNNKSTYVSLFGLEKAQKDYLELSECVLDMFKSAVGAETFITKYIKALTDRVN